MKRSKLFAILLFAIITITACGSNKSESDYSIQENNMEMEAKNEESMEIADEALTGTNKGGNTSTYNSNQKLIKTISMDVETKEFDDLLDNLADKVNSLDGYIESSQISGNRYGYETMRNASLRIRIPCEKLEQFVSIVEKDANVTSKTEDTEDITLQYVDMKSHLEALRAEQESLMKILESAKKVEDIIKIQSQLTNVRYEIESYESQIRTFDNQVNYSTVTVYIDEVVRETSKETESIGEEIAARFSENMYKIGQGFQHLIIWFVSSLPYLVIWAVIIGLGLIFFRKIIKGKKQRKHEKEENRK